MNISVKASFGISSLAENNIIDQAIEKVDEALNTPKNSRRNTLTVPNSPIPDDKKYG